MPGSNSDLASALSSMQMFLIQKQHLPVIVQFPPVTDSLTFLHLAYPCMCEFFFFINEHTYTVQYCIGKMYKCLCKTSSQVNLYNCCDTSALKFQAGEPTISIQSQSWL